MSQFDGANQGMKLMKIACCPHDEHTRRCENDTQLPKTGLKKTERRRKVKRKRVSRGLHRKDADVMGMIYNGEFSVHLRL